MYGSEFFGTVDTVSRSIVTMTALSSGWSEDEPSDSQPASLSPASASFPRTPAAIASARVSSCSRWRC
jgi:hypothetical protein